MPDLVQIELDRQAGQELVDIIRRTLPRVRSAASRRRLSDSALTIERAVRPLCAVCHGSKFVANPEWQFWGEPDLPDGVDSDHWPALESRKEAYRRAHGPELLPCATCARPPVPRKGGR